MQNVTLLHSNFSETQLSGEIFLLNSHEQVGTYEFYVKDESFVAAINIFPEFQNKGIGFYVFKSCFEELNKSNTLNYFIASWSFDKEYSHLPHQQSVNLTAFQNSINTGMDEDKALWETPSGKWLKRIGFTTASLTQRDNEGVKAVFTKLFKNYD